MRADPLVQAVLTRFPGAEIVEVRAAEQARVSSRARDGAAATAADDAVDDAARRRRADETMKEMRDGGFHGPDEAGGRAQSKMEAMQAELDQYRGRGDGGRRHGDVRLTGKGEMKGVKIDDSLIKPAEKEIVEDLDCGGACGCAPQGRDR